MKSPAPALRRAFRAALRELLHDDDAPFQRDRDPDKERQALDKTVQQLRREYGVADAISYLQTELANDTLTGVAFVLLRKNFTIQVVRFGVVTTTDCALASRYFARLFDRNVDLDD